MNNSNTLNFILLATAMFFLIWRLYNAKKIKDLIPQYLKQGAVIIDVRSPAEFAQNANPQSINIPLDLISSKTASLDKNKYTLVCCASGARSAMALQILKQNGFKNIINAGSWQNTLTH